MATAEPDRRTREQRLMQARERLQRTLEQYARIEAEVRELERGNFRVVIFGSARIMPQDEIYRKVYRIARAAAERGIDIVTGGGPGLMDAANSAVVEVTQRESRSYGLPIDIPSLREPANRHLDIKSSHTRFSTRLDEFMRLSHAVVVAPGGIGTLLELVYVWQLLQVSLINDRPVILLGREMWGGLLTWMRRSLLARGYIDADDFRWIKVVDSEQEVIDLITMAHERFMRTLIEHTPYDAEVDRSITREVIDAPTELTEEGWEKA